MKLNVAHLFYIGIVLLGLIACKKQPVVLDYCKMLSEDQSYVNTDKTDMVKFDGDKEERRKMFKRNFELIMQKTKQDGFPYVSLNQASTDSCKFWAVSMTMIHTAQSSPDVFFSKNYADLFKQELDKGNLENRLLEQPSIITAKTMDLCDELKADIEYAIRL